MPGPDLVYVKRGPMGEPVEVPLHPYRDPEARQRRYELARARAVGLTKTQLAAGWRFKPVAWEEFDVRFIGTHDDYRGRHALFDDDRRVDLGNLFRWREHFACIPRPVETDADACEHPGRHANVAERVFYKHRQLLHRAREIADAPYF